VTLLHDADNIIEKHIGTIGYPIATFRSGNSGLYPCEKHDFRSGAHALGTRNNNLSESIASRRMFVCKFVVFIDVIVEPSSQRIFGKVKVVNWTRREPNFSLHRIVRSPNIGYEHVESSRRCSSVRVWNTSASIALSRNIVSYCSRPTVRSISSVSIMAPRKTSLRRSSSRSPQRFSRHRAKLYYYRASFSEFWKSVLKTRPGICSAGRPLTSQTAGGVARSSAWSDTVRPSGGRRASPAGRGRYSLCGMVEGQGHSR
jgi:hypothetical protein